MREKDCIDNDLDLKEDGVRIPPPRPGNDCTECCKALTPNNKAKWGITRPARDLDCECHMICVKDVLLICAVDDQYVDIPVCVCDGTASCRGTVIGPYVPISCEAFVTCAGEELQPDCDGVDIKIGLQAIVRCDSTYVVCQTEIFKKCKFHDFVSFPGGNYFPKNPAGRSEFQQIVRKVDGSCLDIEIKRCEILDTVNPRVRITFKVVDKLWKHENLLVSAIRPYGGRYSKDRDIVVNREFGPPQSIPECGNDTPNNGCFEAEEADSE